jgi:hypothetical protein
MRIQIKDIGVEQRQAKGFTFRTQTGWTNLNGETRKVPISLEEGQPAYEVGSYELGDGCFYFAQYGKLALGGLELVRVAAVPGASGSLAGKTF